MNDPDHYYLFAMHLQRNYHILARKDGYRYQTLASNSKAYVPGQWQQVRIVMDGSKLTVYVNGQEDLEATDSEFTRGTIALHAWGSPGAEFRRISLTPLKVVLRH